MSAYSRAIYLQSFSWENMKIFLFILKRQVQILVSIIAFLALLKILDATHAIDTVVNVIVAALERFSGDAAYTAVIASTFRGIFRGLGQKMLLLQISLLSQP